MQGFSSVSATTYSISGDIGMAMNVISRYSNRKKKKSLSYGSTLVIVKNSSSRSSLKNSISRVTILINSTN